MPLDATPDTIAHHKTAREACDAASAGMAADAAKMYTDWSNPPPPAYKSDAQRRVHMAELVMHGYLSAPEVADASDAGRTHIIMKLNERLSTTTNKFRARLLSWSVAAETAALEAQRAADLAAYEGEQRAMANEAVRAAERLAHALVRIAATALASDRITRADIEAVELARKIAATHHLEATFLDLARAAGRA